MDDISAGDMGRDEGRATTAVEEASEPFIGRWSRLISKTNWEKGRIVCQWRKALRSAGAPATEYSDEAWSRRVGCVSGQHVGRLRRVSERFGRVHGQYEGLYWSHFQAALDWNDAEMWLEGAVQNGWSVSQMRRQRWEILEDNSPAPRDEDVISSELDEDFEPAPETPPGARTIDSQLDEVRATTPEPRDGGKPGKKEKPKSSGRTAEPSGAEEEADSDLALGDASLSSDFAARPFENLAELPDDLAAPFEALKLAILRHKADQWRSISCEQVLASLDALKQLASAPAAGDGLL